MEELKYKVGFETDPIKPSELVDPSAIQALVELQKEVEAYKQQLKELEKVEKEQGQLTEEQSAQQQQLRLDLKATQDQYARINREIQNHTKAANENTNTYQGLVNENKRLMDAMRNLPLDDTTGELQRLQEQYNRNNDTLKEFDAKLGNHQRNVGNYTSALDGTAAILSKLPGPIAGANRGVEIFNATLKANPMGLLVAAIVGLLAIFTKLEPVQKVINHLTMVFGETLTFVSNALSTWIDGQERNIRSLKEQIELTKQLNLAEKNLAIARGQTPVAIANVEQEIAKINLRLAEGNLSQAERSKLLEDLAKKENDIIELKKNELLIERNALALQLEKVRGTEKEQDVRDSILATEAALIALDTEGINARTTATNKQNEARKKASEDEQKRIEQEKAAMESLAAARSALTEKSLQDLEKIRKDELSFADTLIGDIDIEDSKGKFALVAELLNKELTSQTIARLEEQGKFVESAEQQRLIRQQELEQLYLMAGLNEYEAYNSAKEQADLEYESKLKEAKQREIDLEKATQEAKLALAQTTASNLVSIGEGLFGKSKALAVAQAIIDTFGAANNAAKNTPGGVIAKSIAAAAMVAQGLANVRKILSTKPGGGGAGGGGMAAPRPAMSTMAVSPAGNIVSPDFARGQLAGQVATDATSPGMQLRPVQVSANVDRRGLAIAVREGERSIRTQQFDFK
jgi:hypothetical protein